MRLYSRNFRAGKGKPFATAYLPQSVATSSGRKGADAEAPLDSLMASPRENPLFSANRLVHGDLVALDQRSPARHFGLDEL